ncbi:O-antigen polymerase [Prevotella intermedia]|uniref:Oligosaccharide repeat unit polymerase n=1 Tax=Prevotella intermedia TaxID=28131 RepID=A0A2D3LK61_PREIN|nr:O-antigen polymerase [Prevotella intermedia]ATV30934.1 oligosaccharide repeat unit polymerase [Prevotella intermedia]PJI22817.1 oligosaccharide repeat unit polymerase [Prevotella intermedia]
MSVIESNYILSAFLILLWVITLIWYQHKNKNFDAGSFIIVMYIIYAVFSIMTINDDSIPQLTNYEPLTLFPYLYLYVMMMIALTPAIYHHTNSTDSIEYPQSNILRIIATIIIVVAILNLPGIVSDFRNGLMSIFTDAEAGKKAYMEQIDNASNVGGAIRNIPAILFNSFSDIGIFLLFYFMTMSKKNHKIIYGLLFANVINLIMPVMRGQRSGVALAFLTIICGYFLFKQYLSKRLNKVIKKIGIVFIAIITLPVAAITISRFGSEKAGVATFINWYIGQGNIYFNNHALDDNGLRYGDRTLNLFKRLVDSKTSMNYVERRETYSKLKINDEVFSTFVGDFTIDFGPFFAVIIFIVFNFFVIYSFQKNKTNNNKIRLHQLLLLYFTVCISAQGGMYLFSYSDTRNLNIIVLALLYYYLKYHEALLEKFPLKKQNK